MSPELSLAKAFRRAARFIPAARWCVDSNDGSIESDGFWTVSFLPPIAALTFGNGTSGIPVTEFSVSGAGVILSCSTIERKTIGDHIALFASVLRVQIREGPPSVRWRGAWFDLQFRYPFLDSADALESFVNDWRAGVLPKECWTHAAHVAVTGYYAFDRQTEAVFDEMKRGILYFNASVGGVNGPDSGYHETLTRFWSNRITGSVREAALKSRFDAAAYAVRLFGEDRDLPHLFYSFDVVRDRRARREWVAPDLEPLAEWCGAWAMSR